MSNTEDISKLNRRRGAVKHKLTAFTKYLSRVQVEFDGNVNVDANIEELTIRLKGFEGLWKEFEEIQIDIEYLVTDDNLDEQYQLRTSFEDIYTHNLIVAKGILRRYEVNEANCDKISHLTEESNHAGQQDEMQPFMKQVRLPVIDLPKFDGNFNHWLEFKDTFESLIHNNSSIVNIQKFHYLKASLGGDALKIIQSIDFTAHNYDLAWQLIGERYNNKRLLVQNHIKSIFELEPLTKESARSIRNLVDTIFRHLRALGALEQPVHHWDAMLIYIITSKMDIISVREWEKSKEAVENPTLANLKTFLYNRADFLETFELNYSLKRKESCKPETRKSTFLLGGNREKVKICNLCKKDHVISSCREFLDLGVLDRIQKIKQLKLCTNCLCYGHWVNKCRSKPCAKCARKHNLLLHAEDTSAVDAQVIHNNENSNKAHVSLISRQGSLNTVLLSTVVIWVKDRNGVSYKCRAVLDSGSMSNLITQKLAKRLQLSYRRTNVSLIGINKIESKLNYTCNLIIQSRISDFTASVSCFVVPNTITDELPAYDIDISSWKIPGNVELADNEFNLSKGIDLLIGSELFWNLLKNESIILGKQMPILQNTVLGWIVSGTVNQKMVKTHCNFIKATTNELNEDISRFWELEEVDLKLPQLNEEQRLCELHFVKYYSRQSDGRFIVRIPLKIPRTELGDLRQMAIKRFFNLERKLNDDALLKVAYCKFMKEYLDLGHMEVSKNDGDRSIAYFLPHHGVLRPESLSTKLRVVFDASAKTTSGLSLNDIQYTGPACQSEIFDILVRFRQRKYVVCADIAKMYRQILVHPDDRPLQQIFWRPNPDQPLLAYTLKTVTYGTASAPYLAIRCVKQVAVDIKGLYPEASNIINKDVYVDDLITGFDDKNVATSVCNDISKALHEAGFPLRKWSSNSKDIITKQEHVDRNLDLLFADEEVIKTLGISWNNKFDTISFTIKEIVECDIISKRTILSNVSKLFDPLGLVSPCIILIKILMQRLWLLNLAWDEPVPLEMKQTWLKFKESLISLNELKLRRHVAHTEATTTELHGFCDASCEAYAAAVYLRSMDQKGEIEVNLLCSKTKVAPLKKQLTVPKLELCGAVLLARLINKVTNAFGCCNLKCFLWSDSQIVLSWIKAIPGVLPRFEGNRISQIQELTANYIWAYVNTKNNPADVASRGIFPNMILSCNIWWFGPKFLKLPSKNWPCDPKPKQSVFICTTTTNDLNLFNKFSNLTKLKRVVAYCIRFVKNLKCSKQQVQRKLGYLTVEELNDSLIRLIKLSQMETYHQELKLLASNKPLEKNNELLALNPFLDEHQILRVGGRLRYSQLNFNSKHPILLDGKHPFTRLIIESEHKRLFHAGPQLLLATIRQTYWPTSGMNTIKRVTRNCITCYKFKPQPMSTLMADLPKERVTITSPFYNTGIDYAGPFYLKDKKGRGSKLYKGYVCLFVCLTIKAIHLELVTDLTTESFISTLRRFSARRGKPNCIYSDNATNFTGAQKELKNLYAFLTSTSEQIAEICASENINWKFIPPSAPHFGGIWESAVKSCKYHLLRVIGDTHLIYEEFQTLLVQIEATLISSL